MATKKVKVMGLVKIEQATIDKVKKKIIGSKETIGGYIKEATEEKLKSKLLP